MSKNILSKAKKVLTNKRTRFMMINKMGFYKRVPDEEFLKKQYRVCFGKELNLENPVTFNEKLQWLKLYNRKPIYTTMVDKVDVKKYVADIIGEQYIIPTLGVWDHFDDIDFDKLPDQFVLKCSHDSGGLVIVKDKSKLDKKAAKAKIEKCLKRNYYWIGREWAYKNVKPRILAEKYMENNSTKDLRDYKIFCFDGVAKALFIATDRQAANVEVKFDFYDMDFNHLDVRNGHSNSDVELKKPEKFDEMISLANKLSQNIPHVRVDFYEVNGKVYFGELTFCHFSGMTPFDPEAWDVTFGSWIKLPEKFVGE